MRNKALPGTIEIEKEATPQSAQAFGFSGTLGDFSLVDAAGGTSSSKTFTVLAPGTYTVSEAVPADWEFTGVTCTNPGVAITDPQVAITLTPGGSVVCTYRNTRFEPPVPPTPPVPRTPPVPPDGGGVLPDVSSSTTLSINKTAPRVARVGQRIRFTVTVTNTGTVAATGVRAGRITCHPAQTAERWHMITQAEIYRDAVKLLRDLPPHEQCRHIVQMVYDGSLTHEQGKELLYTLVDHEIDASAQRH